MNKDTAKPSTEVAALNAEITALASRVVPTAPENRPKNVALLYCEKN